MTSQDEKLVARVKGWMYLAEGAVTIAGGLLLLGVSLLTPMLSVAFGLFTFVALLVPALWFLRMGRLSRDKANEPPRGRNQSRGAYCLR